jgi:hypothetical protein
MNRIRIAMAAAMAATLASPLVAQTSDSCAAHHAGVESRGDHVMGFDHEKTTHHFRLTPTGGVIEVTANSESDTASRDMIRVHLSHIAGMFSEADFEAPMLIHDQVPPGVPVMKAKRKAITYTFEDLPTGGEVVIATKDAKALEAVHEFLRFQIEDHETGDSPDVTAPKPQR